MTRVVDGIEIGSDTVSGSMTQIKKKSMKVSGSGEKPFDDLSASQTMMNKPGTSMDKTKPPQRQGSHSVIKERPSSSSLKGNSSKSRV